MQFPTQSGDTMKALVAVKRVVDYNVKVRAKADGSDVDLNNVKMAINPFAKLPSRKPFDSKKPVL
jgi:hypothetical protein